MSTHSHFVPFSLLVMFPLMGPVFTCGLQKKNASSYLARPWETSNPPTSHAAMTETLASKIRNVTRAIGMLRGSSHYYHETAKVIVSCPAFFTENNSVVENCYSIVIETREKERVSKT